MSMVAAVRWMYHVGRIVRYSKSRYAQNPARSRLIVERENITQSRGVLLPLFSLFRSDVVELVEYAAAIVMFYDGVVKVR